MIIDSRSLEDDKALQYDICVIGAGAAGITIALEFLGSNKKICMLESGGLEYDGEIQRLYSGINSGLDYFPLVSARLRYFGGSTNHWGGMCLPLQKLDFEPRSWIPESGWPFGYEELEPYYKRAHKICELDEFDYSPEWLEEVLSAKRFPLDENYFVPVVIRYSPPTRFGKEYRDEISNAKNIDLYLYATVMELESDENASHVERVQCITSERRKFTVKARHYILATGGIENARILLLSNQVNKAGLGNTNGLVGRFFMEHPHRNVGQIIPTDPYIDAKIYHGKRWRRMRGVRANAYISPSTSLQKKEKLNNVLFGLIPHFQENEEEQDRSLLDRIGDYLRRKRYIDVSTYSEYFMDERPIDYFEVTAAFEQSPNFESRIKLAEEKDYLGQNKVELHWAIDERDLNSLERTVELFAREIGRSNIGRMRVDIKIKDWPAGYHHMGTTRMHVDPERGVVDENCRMHEVDNLYVAGSSVFPVSGAANPTLTLVALAIRLSDHLKETMT